MQHTCPDWLMSLYVPALLAIDDEAVVRDFLREALLPWCDHLCVVESAREALRCMETHGHDILLVDICLPEVSGIDLLQVADQLHWDCAVILMTGHATLDQVAGGVRLEAADLLLKPFTLRSLADSIELAYHKLRRKRERQRERDSMSSRQLDQSHRSALLSLIASLEAREYATYSHSFRVRSYALHLAALIGYPDPDITGLAFAALLHDIGKIAAPDSILLKPGALTPGEYSVLKGHSAIGERIVSRMGFMAAESKIIRHHHEYWNGRGYPDGLQRETIPLGSRLFAVADALDAMTSDRCYRKALSLTRARQEILRCAGSQFDPRVTEAFHSVDDDVWIDLRRQADTFAEAVRLPDFSTDAVAFDSQALLAQSPASLSQ
jgi:putative nucleotidyltransferase with HDIG domain